VRKTYRRVMAGSLAAVTVAALLIGLFGRLVIRIWAGSGAVPGSLLLWMMSGWVVLLSYTVNQAMLLAATRRLKLQAVTSAIAAALNITLSIILVQRIGAIGVLIGTISSYVLFVWAPQAYEIRRILRGDRQLATVC
jgi:O-antigen/teichoic acid export membrane protein